MATHFGKTEPRLWTRPLRELHDTLYDDDGNVVKEATSLGFEVIEFALIILGIDLYPWQKWLLIHALELLEDGRYRFKRVIVLVARQNGKTTLASVLAAWWLFVDSERHKDRVPPLKFKVVGVAQNLDIAREPWSMVKVWADPKPETDEDRELALEDLQGATKAVVDTNGKESIVARSRAHYEIRAGKNARGKPAARVLMDEMREQKDWSAWNSVSQTTKAFWSGMLIGFSNAGDSSSVVLRKQRTAAMLDLKAAGFDFDADWIQAGIEAAEDHANGEDIEVEASLGLFEWSAPPGCPKDDVGGILQANPSIGYGEITVASCYADIHGMTDAGYRTEVLCQWVTANVNSYIDVKEWQPRRRAIADVRIPFGGRTVWGIDLSIDRRFTWVSAATLTEDGLPFVTVRTKRTGSAWVVDYMRELAEESGFREVVLQGKGCPAMEFIEPLEKAGLIVHKLEGSQFALATGRIRDRVRDRELVVVTQPDVDLAVEGGVVTKYGDNLAWSREKSMPIDISGLIAESEALYALEVLAPPPRQAPPPPPPKAELVTREDVAPTEANLATVAF